MNFHHIGVATNNIELTIKHYNIFGYKQSTELFLDPIQNVYILFLEKVLIILFVVSIFTTSSFKAVGFLWNILYK